MGGDGVLKTVSVVPVEAGAAVVGWGRVRFADIPAFQRETRARIGGALARQTTVRPGPAVTFSRPASGDAVEIAPGVLAEGRFEPVDGLTLQPIPAGRAAHARLEAPYAALPRAWQELMGWVAAQGLRPAGLHWEVYRDPSGPVTELYTLLE